MAAMPSQPQTCAGGVPARTNLSYLKVSMLNKLISKFKATQAAPINPAHAAAADAISTPEKAASLVAQLEAARDAAE